MMDELSWEPSASIEMLHQRAHINAIIRKFFTTRHYLEVETPVMARYGVTDVYLSNIKASFRNVEYCLQTSPEYHMKRLLAAGAGSIFQLARVFRDDELGRWHNPEFTLLEWYQLGVDHHTLMTEVDDFLQTVMHSEPMIRKTYQSVFIEACGIDPLNASLKQLKAVVADYDLDTVLSADEQDRDQYLFLLMTHVVEPFLSTIEVPVAIYNFPASQAALAKVHGAIAERFEIYFKGIELANGFHELTDKDAQLARFLEDQRVRKEKGLMSAAADSFLLGALEHGLPSCSGVALGVDRLMALALNQPGISQVLSFDFSRA